MRRSTLLLLPLLALSFVAPASAKPKKLEGAPQAVKDLEAKVKDLEKSKDPRTDFDALTTWLDVPATCSKDGCDSIKAQWLTGNLDDDAPDERVLVLTTKGKGSCPETSLEVFVLDPTSKTDARVLGYAHASVGAAKAAEVTLANVHSATMKDLVVRTEGGCGTSEHVLRVFTLETGRLEELVSSADSVGTSLTSHTFVGKAPVAIELTTAKGKTKLAWDPAQGYDAFPSYEAVKKTTISGSEDDTLGPTDCSAPLPATLATECRLRGSAKVEVLVQKGKALGMTVSTDPLDRDFAHCVRKVLSNASWKSTAGASGCSRSWIVK